ncbi:MAG: hypothetical protein ACLFTK_14060, partial [Anaerolineales bacterium]
MQQFLSHFQAQLGPMVWRLQTLVEAETPTYEKDYVDEFGSWIAEWAEQHGASVTEHPFSVVVNAVECRFNASAPGKPILILGHM